MNHPDRSAPTRRAVLGGAAATGIGMALASGGAATAVAGGHHGSLGQDTIDSVVARYENDLIALRRDLHEHPETSGNERRTAAVVAGRLRTAGLEVTTGVGGEGVVAVLKGELPGRTVAYRADMDAVPPEGIATGGTEAAHVCGHDIHTTVGVGVAEVLARLRNRLHGTVVFYFQPGEEALVGARAMIDSGVLGWTAPEEIHALHCGPFPVGRFAVTPGSGLPGQDRSVIELSGPDALVSAQRLAEEIGELATVAPPQTPADLERMVADVQTPDGPLARFVVVRAKAAEAGAEGTAEVQVSYRCWPEERYVEVREDIRRLAEPYAGAQVSFPAAPFPAMVCPPREANVIARHLRRLLGPDGVTTLHAAFPFNGEDFALFLDRLPGTYTFLGVRAPGAGITSSYPHYGDFTPDERAIGVGVRAMSGWLASRSRS